MITEKQIEQLVAENLEGTDRFLVALKVSSTNVIQVFIDADSAVTIDHCVALSRHIEGSLDRETEDFELKVMSSGADRPFSLLRQYKKNIGNKVDVLTTEDNKIRGVLLEADDKVIKIQQEKTVTRGKSKKTIIGEELTLPMSEVSQTKVVITF
ncbi:MAG: ribosome assembly cofactor RimP [Bacteroidetes bacterium]|nr:MAG: ribosome assembly cofactor RimP [Bacteroidota bacterium]